MSGIPSIIRTFGRAFKGKAKSGRRSKHKKNTPLPSNSDNDIKSKEKSEPKQKQPLTEKEIARRREARERAKIEAQERREAKLKEEIEKANKANLPLGEYRRVRAAIKNTSGKFFTGFYHCNLCRQKRWEGYEYTIGEKTYAICKKCIHPNSNTKKSGRNGYMRIIYTPMGNKR